MYRAIPTHCYIVTTEGVKGRNVLSWENFVCNVLTNILRPVRSNGPETHAKPSAHSYTFDLWRVFQQCCQGIAATFCSKSSRGGRF
jgi:hypothetical protein